MTSREKGREVMDYNEAVKHMVTLVDDNANKYVNPGLFREALAVLRREGEKSSRQPTPGAGEDTSVDFPGA